MKTHPIAASWIDAEWEAHASTKYGEAAAGREINTTAITDLDYDRMFNFVFNYLKRVELFGLDTPQGKQARSVRQR